MKWWDQMPWSSFFEYWVLKSAFSLFSFTFIKRLFSSSLLSAIRVVSFAYLRLLIFLPASLIPACASSSLAFPMMYSAYKLNKQGDNIQPWHTPFLIWNQSVVPCPVLAVASWPAYRFLKRHVTSCEELTHQKRPWCWEGLGAGGEGDDRGWDGWIASLTRWTWV